MLHSELIDNLNKLIQTHLDGKNGYLEAARTVNNDTLASSFEDFAKQREQFARTLTDVVVRLKGHPADEGTTNTDIQHGWMDVKSAFSNGGEDAILEACIRGEDTAIRNFRDVLRNPIPDGVIENVWDQYDTIKEIRDHLKSMQQVVTR